MSNFEKKITIRITRKDFEYLQTRRISLSQWVRAAIRQLQLQHNFLKEVMRKKRLDPEYRKLENERMRKYLKEYRLLPRRSKRQKYQPRKSLRVHV